MIVIPSRCLPSRQLGLRQHVIFDPAERSTNRYFASSLFLSSTSNCLCLFRIQKLYLWRTWPSRPRRENAMLLARRNRPRSRNKIRLILMLMYVKIDAQKNYFRSLNLIFDLAFTHTISVQYAEGLERLGWWTWTSLGKIFEKEGTTTRWWG